MILAGRPTPSMSAEVDGAGVWHKVWHITLPALRHILLITLILQVIVTSRCSPSRT